MDFKSVKELIKLINDSQIMDFQINCNDINLKMVKNEIQFKEEKGSLTIKALSEKNTQNKIIENYIISPVVGTCYLSLDKENKSVTKLGDKVKIGDVVCKIEILNIIYEIKSSVDGQIVEIFLQDGCMVEYGQKLFKIAQI